MHLFMHLPCIQLGTAPLYRALATGYNHRQIIILDKRRWTFADVFAHAKLTQALNQLIIQASRTEQKYARP